MMFTFHLEAVVPGGDVSGLSSDTPHPAVVDMAQAVRAAGMKVSVCVLCVWAVSACDGEHC